MFLSDGDMTVKKKMQLSYFDVSIPLYDDTGDFLEYSHIRVYADNKRLALKKILMDYPNINEKDVYWISI